MASSSALDDQVVSRASIILENQSDWKLWYSMKKQFATVKGVWEYCDPSTTKQPIHMNTRNYAPGVHGCATLIGCSLSEGP
jgi:hypothetical protein